MKTSRLFWVDDFYIQPQYLAAYRIIFCLIIVFFIGLPAYTWIGYAPDFLFFPSLSIAMFFSGFPSTGFLQVVTTLNLIFFFLMFLGVRTKWVSVLFSLTCLLGHSFWYAFGKVDHLLLWMVTPIFLGFAGWGDYLSIDQLWKSGKPGVRDTNPEATTFALTLLAFSIAFSMFTAGIQKIWGGWAHWEADASLYHVIRNYFSTDKDKMLAPYVMTIDNQLFWKLQDYATLLLEIGFIFSVVKVRVFRVFVAIAVFFHIMVWLFLNIPFYSNLIVYVIFLDWEGMDRMDKIKRLIASYTRRGLPFYVILIFATLVTGYWLIYSILDTRKLILPGVVESAMDCFHIKDSNNLAMHSFFGVATLVLIYLVVDYVRSLNVKDHAAAK